MRKDIVFISLLTLFMIGCSDKKNNNLQDVTPIVIDWSNISKEMDYSSWVEDSVLVVPLETRDDCLIGEISNLVYQNHRIYIADGLSKAVYVFDESGHLYSKVRAIGNGPEEYLEISAFSVLNGRMFIYDKMKEKIFIYNDDGQFLYTKDVSKIWGREMFFQGNDLYLFNSSSRTDMGYYSLFKLDTEEGKDEAKASFPFEYQETAGWSINRYTSAVENEVLFTMWPYDMLYLLKNGIPRPVYKVDFGNRRLPEQYIKADGVTALTAAIRDNYITGIEWIGLSSYYILFSCHDKDGDIVIVYNRKTGEIAITRKLYNSQLGEFVINPIRSYIQNGYIVQSQEISSWVIGARYGHVNYDDYEFHSEHTRSLFKKFQQMDEESNPVIIIQKFKE
ncbi:6-bladed beta-propeller [uncultured Mediterranea sp.]|uniref:6-bladed beta-propeller n=1 Tax=uncultured Mediterranea sp. TaxID=1926662 RepID=UPI0027D963AD|nr:6-bladed beta-propeller [uncultured Mediterranea sp.]